MRFPPAAPILALLALGGACALERPKFSSEQGGSAGSTSPSSDGSGGSGGASVSGGSTGSVSGGSTAKRDAGVTGGTSATAGTTTATSTGSTPSGGTTPAGGSSGGNATGGSTTGGTRTTTGGTMALGGSTASGGSTAIGGSSAVGGSTSTGSTHAQPPPITNGSNGFTTRYWDCCKPSCGWSANANGKPTKTCGKDGTSTVNNDTQSACNGGGGYMCYWGAPWSVSDTLSYGFAAHNGASCGTCFQIQFTGKGQYNAGDPGSNAINGKTMIVQVINVGGIDSNQFDLLIPGGGVGANNACTGGSAQWSGVDIGAGSGGMLTTCKDDKACVQQKCQAAFGDKPLLLAGCNWVTGWFSAAENPQILYKQIACPSEITAKSGI